MYVIEIYYEVLLIEGYFFYCCVILFVFVIFKVVNYMSLFLDISFVFVFFFCDFILFKYFIGERCVYRKYSL